MELLHKNWIKIELNVFIYNWKVNWTMTLMQCDNHMKYKVWNIKTEKCFFTCFFIILYYLSISIYLSIYLSNIFNKWVKFINGKQYTVWLIKMNVTQPFDEYVDFIYLNIWEITINRTENATWTLQWTFLSNMQIIHSWINSLKWTVWTDSWKIIKQTKPKLV